MLIQVTLAKLFDFWFIVDKQRVFLSKLVLEVSWLHHLSAQLYGLTARFHIYQQKISCIKMFAGKHMVC